MAEDKITRRRFVRQSATAAASVAVAASAVSGGESPPVEKTRSHNENMEYRPLGKTGLMISAISLGGHWKKVPFRYGSEEFKKNRREVISACIDHGINYVDACCGSEVLTYSEALRGRRDKIYLGFSYCEHEMRHDDWQTAEKLTEALDELMGRAKLEYVDFWRPTCYWNPSTDHTVAQEEEMIAALDKAQKAGKVRFTGMSTHKHSWAIRMIQTYPKHIQAIVLPYTAGSKKAHARVDTGNTNYKVVPKEESLFDASMVSLIDVVNQSKVGWIGIKPFASGSVFKSRGMPDSPTKEEDDERARLTLRYVLCNEALTCTIPGLVTVDQVENAAKAVKQRRELDMEETAKLNEAVEQMWANLPHGYQWLKKEWEYV